MGLVFKVMVRTYGLFVDSGLWLTELGLGIKIRVRVSVSG